MTASLSINPSELTEKVQEVLNSVKVSCQAAMANRLASIIDHNFGDYGEDRPETWPALSSSYARVFHSGNQIPKLILTGDLQASIELDESSVDAAEVFTQNPYARSHQFGEENNNLPARPFFPMVEGQLTEYSAQECINACARQLERSLS